MPPHTPISACSLANRLAGYQAVQHMITDMAVKIENMKNFVYKIAWMMDQGMSVRHEHAMCKLYVAQASFEVIDTAMQIWAGWATPWTTACSGCGVTFG
jgi:alkylation response protein AidB-like acyl-CoA dehydrogenase